MIQMPLSILEHLNGVMESLIIVPIIKALSIQHRWKILDDDLDQFVECEGYDVQTWQGDVQVIGGGDCNDASEWTYPGAAYNTDPTDCLTDLDLDGWVDRSWDVCATQLGLTDGQHKIYSSVDHANLGRDRGC